MKRLPIILLGLVAASFLLASLVFFQVDACFRLPKS